MALCFFTMSCKCFTKSLKCNFAQYNHLPSLFYSLGLLKINACLASIRTGAKLTSSHPSSPSLLSSSFNIILVFLSDILASKCILIFPLHIFISPYFFNKIFSKRCINWYKVPSSSFFVMSLKAILNANDYNWLIISISLSTVYEPSASIGFFKKAK